MVKVLNILKLFLGGVFVFSGFVKLVDPLGTAYKISDYFRIAGIEIPEFAAVILSVLLSVFEFAMGTGLILNLKLRLFSFLSCIFMSIMTIISLILALWRPIEDCGCFGDFIKLSNEATFGKNLILLIFSLFIFTSRNYFRPPVYPATTWIVWSITLILSLYTGIRSYRHLPLIDFRPYAVGVNIKESIDNFRHDAKALSVLKYRNKITGEIRNFTEDNYPWRDSVKWEFVDIVSLYPDGISTGNINDFAVWDTDSRNIGPDILDDDVFMLVLRDIGNISSKEIEKIRQTAHYAVSNDMPFYVVTSSPIETVRKRIDSTGNEIFNIKYGNMDDTQLKTIIRSDPGLLFISKGRILRKWSKRDMPVSFDTVP